MNRTIARIGIVACTFSAACSAVTSEDALDTPPMTASGPTPASQAAAFGNGGGSVSTGAAAAAPRPGGSAATPAAPAAAPVTGGAPAASPAMPLPALPAMAEPVQPVDECGLHTKFAGDQYCIKAPPPDKGFQLHIGPASYDNPDASSIVEPGQEMTEAWMGTSGNDKDVYYFYRQQRMRPGSHHLLINNGSELIVSAQNPMADTPRGGKIAPEDQDVGIALPARSQLFGSMHFINTTDKPILKEVWVNFWYKDASAVKERATPIFTGAPINIPPGSHVVVSSDCPIMGAGRLIRLFGHKHANNVRWSTYRVRGEQRDLLFEDYDHWEDPLILEYSSVTQNPKPDRATKTPGGWSGMVDLKAGDTFRFECEIVNNTNSTFTGKNEALDDEMCIQNGTIVGTTIARGGCTTASTPVN